GTHVVVPADPGWAPRPCESGRHIEPRTKIGPSPPAIRRWTKTCPPHSRERPPHTRLTRRRWVRNAKRGPLSGSSSKEQRVHRSGDSAQELIAMVEPKPEPTRSGRYCLLVIGDATVASYPLPEGSELVLGRSHEADIRLDDPTIAPHHAVLHVGATVQLRALADGSSTRVRGRSLRTRDPIELAPGDIVEIGATVLMLAPHAPVRRARRIFGQGTFEERVEEECARAERFGWMFALAHIWVGTAAPPSEIEAHLASGLRSVDLVARRSAGEYEVLIVNTLPEQGHQVLARLGERLKRAGLDCKTGLACFPRDGRDAEALLAKAGALAAGERKPARPAASTVVPGRALDPLRPLIARGAGSST